MRSYATLLFWFLTGPLALCQLESKIDSLFSEFSNTPGCAVGIYGKGEILFAKGYGLANLDYDIGITPSTVFDIGSVSKQFTAACLVLLENEGKLTLDDDIRLHLTEMPEFKEGKITIRHLLNHTSGLRDYLSLMYLSGMSFDDYFTEQMGLDILIRQKELNFVPGSEYLYSNSGYLALAAIVRRVSGKSIGTYAQEKIFDPLDMTHTFIYEDAGKVVKNRAIGYVKHEDKFIREHHFDFVLGGDGQVYTTVNDFFKWSENFKSNRLGNDTFLRQLLTRGVLLDGDTIDYALGLSHGEYKGLQTIHHGGAWGGFRAFYVLFPEEDVAIAVMSNLGSVNASQKAYQIADLMMGDKMKIEQVETDGKALRNGSPEKAFLLTQLAGTYEVEPGIDLMIVIKDDSLHVTQSWNQSAYSLVRTSGNAFQIPGEEGIQFTFSDMGDDYAQKLTVSQNGSETLCKRRDEKIIEDVDLRDYAAQYYSDELNVSYQLFLQDEVLQVKFGNEDPKEMSIYDQDVFTCDLGLIRFKRKDGRVSGFELDAGRVQNLQFVVKTD